MALDKDDLDYVKRHFVPLNDVCKDHGKDPHQVRELIRAGSLPSPPYVLPDATEMVPSDYFERVERAGGSDRATFTRRYRDAAKRLRLRIEEGEPESAFGDWIQGLYFVCLVDPTPENVARKRAVIERIERLLSQQALGRPDWRRELAKRVDELDRLERPFTPYDRIRFGEPSSRDRYVRDVRERFLQQS